jgi:anthranilate/para-aminobenzoate synthase component II
MDVLRQLPHVPLLGVCLGHQALAAAAGARVVRAPEPVHGRLSALRHGGHPLFAGCPSGPGAGFDVVRWAALWGLAKG